MAYPVVAGDAMYENVDHAQGSAAPVDGKRR